MRVGLPIYVDYFGNTNIHEWLDEERKEVVDNIHEEVLDDAETVDTDNGPDSKMGENVGLCEPFDKDIGEDEDDDVDLDLPNTFNEEVH
uniref:Uncharacterized protein n=1 Tax=Lactuca sativa TaxID=4236 RepID=A0A9R1V1E3_LACSA|nr:hypothetical protein LSAT_V11C700343210 [Lactuca sativa]